MSYIKVLFEDEDILVVDKPPFLVVTKSETHQGKTLEEILTSDFEIKLARGGIVHRLDKDTSGLLVVAKNLKALENLQSQFKKRQVHKEYLALVHGLISQEVSIAGAIVRNPKNRSKFTVSSAGKEAETKFSPIAHLSFSQYRLLELFPEFSKIQIKKLFTINYLNYTLLACFPLTGRTHQIRVHLKYINSPVVADEKYAGRRRLRLDKRWCPRQFLHAKKLEFTHPVSSERMIFESPLPEDLEKSLEFLDG